jgi:hypothetical protein
VVGVSATNAARQLRREDARRKDATSGTASMMLNPKVRKPGWAATRARRGGDRVALLCSRTLLQMLTPAFGT